MALFSSEQFQPASGQEAAQYLMDEIRRTDGGKPLFLQAAEEVIEDLIPVFESDMRYAHVMRMIVEPERAVSFRVAWTDDCGHIRVNRGFRVQFNSALGPYKGGLRFWPNVTLDTIQFLGFEQIFKNSLTTLRLGGGKGGSDFDPTGKSDGEVMRFCQSFMVELHRHIGATRDVPAGDIGVGGREIGYLFGMYKRLQRSFEGCLTGKNPLWGGSSIRPEATGYGCVYFAQEALKALGEGMEGKRCLVSGSGNVAQYTVEKLLHLGAVPITMSDRKGYIVEPNGFTQEQLEKVMEIKQVRGASLELYTQFSTTATYVPGKRVWEVAGDLAFPSATQNEISQEDAQMLAKNGCKGVFEGANMPSSPEAVAVFKQSNVMYGPGKACNAGGVAVSGLEMAQNAQMDQWSREQVDERLHNIMINIHGQIAAACERFGIGNDMKAGANIAGFLRVADAMIQQGAV